MPDSRYCPACGTAIVATSPAGLCPKCLLQAGFESQPAVTSPSPRGKAAPFAAPDVQELAASFPELEIMEMIGQGGMGAVYKARQRGLDRLVAVKILPPEVGDEAAFAERFRREARALGQLSHPHIVAVYDFGQRSGLYYFVMEYVDGVNLRQAIQSHTMTPPEALAIIPQICDALQFAHDEGIVHRDIKPENILIDKRGRVKIADFGLAKLLGMEEAEQRLTNSLQVMGTLRYMAPEQMEGSHAVDHRADIYSLGVVFYELLTGELPVGRFAPPSKKVQIDVRLDEVVLRALEKEPAERYQAVSQVKTEVEAITSIAPAAAQRLFGREYRSQAEIFGVPLLHIAYGLNPKTGKKRVARGIIAIGDIAVGLVAIGGAAFGGLCMGGFALGLLSLGGAAIGLWAAIGGCAIGGVAFGGLALGGVAVGGCAVGIYAFGGFGIGFHVLASNRQNPSAAAFFEPWAFQWSWWLTWLSLAMPVSFVAIYGFIWSVFWAQAQAKAASGKPQAVRRPWLVPIIATMNLPIALALMLVTASVQEPWRQDIGPFWRVWEYIDAILAFAMAAALFTASVGLYLWQPWARKLLIGTCIFGLASLVIGTPYLARVVIPYMTEEIKQDLVDEDLLVPADAGAADELAAEPLAVATVIVAVVVGSTVIFPLVCLIGQLIYFTRPKVVAAFSPPTSPRLSDKETRHY